MKAQHQQIRYLATTLIKMFVIINLLLNKIYVLNLGHGHWDPLPPTPLCPIWTP